MNEKLCLGTVQFGLQYGINNVLDRKPDVDECFDILDYAISMGIGCFDTASVYGNAEQIIGSYKGFNDNVKIISKLRPMLNDSDLSQDSIVQECENTLKRLDKKTLYGYLIHSAADMYNEEVLAGLHKCKKSGLVENIGVSTYTPEEAVYAVKNTDFNFIQIPYNVLDQRLNYSDFFEPAKERNAKIFARSAFLQGLLTMEIQQIKAKMPKAVEYVEEFEKICPFEIRKIPWIENGFYYDGDKVSPAKHPYYFAGLYYLQEPSAMTPANRLPVEPGDKRKY